MPSYVITGAARGIGFEFVTQLSASGANTIFGLVRNKAVATELNALSSSRKNITVLQADITDVKALELAANEVSEATGGKLDFLINNAAKSNHPGFTLDGFPSPEAVEYDLLDNFKTNTIGVVHTTNAFLPLLKNGSVKKVISISSGISDLGLTLLGEIAAEPCYAISKAALNMVVAKYAAQYRAEGFTFLAICPGLVSTSMAPTEETTPGEMKMLAPALPKVAPGFKGPISPEESVRMQLELRPWKEDQFPQFFDKIFLVQ
ncbi:hypothetical protein B0H14DRAFT_2604048 [Mycena olivaceomarginata]|nr:hypothetical protein B0H14DRAFT_2604048 [Mycena olivaceomarginata]